jgi:hypothetical protein
MSEQRATIEDPAGEAWQAEADRRWRAANRKRRPEDYVAPPLPTWSGPDHVHREIFGAFLFDPSENVVHRVATATEACDLDRINPAVFVHFGHELAQHYPEATSCPNCLTD